MPADQWLRQCVRATAERSVPGPAKNGQSVLVTAVWTIVTAVILVAMIVRGPPGLRLFVLTGLGAVAAVVGIVLAISAV